MKIRLFYIILLSVALSVSGCNKDSNQPPVIVEVVPGIQKTTMMQTIRFTCTVDDDNNSALSYSWSSDCGSFKGEANTNSVSWQAPGEVTTCNISVSVSDGEFTDDYSFSVNVEKPEEPEEPEPPLAGVYYYPWHGGSNFHGGRYLREYLDPVQTPELGEYNDRDEEVIAQHLEWSRYAGIGLWVGSWWGPGKMEDKTLLEYILPHSEIQDMKIALFYETSGRMTDFEDVSNVASDIAYIAENYFDHPNYFKIDGRPVLFVYLTRVLSRNGILEETTEIMREEARLAGYELYIIGDQVFGNPPSSTDQLALLDAVTNYDVYGSSGGKMYATQEKVDNYYDKQSTWRSMAHQVGTSFVPATAPGYNDTGVRDGHVPLSRKLNENAEFGSLFKAMLTEAVKITDPETGNLFMITSWNEWHEDTQIEPVAVAPPTSKDQSSSGEKYTAGLEYEGYGLRYLDILKELIEQ